MEQGIAQIPENYDEEQEQEQIENKFEMEVDPEIQQINGVNASESVL